jgi:hypothetical protein
MEKKETIYDILYTPVEKLTDDQVRFMEKVVKVGEEYKKKPWYVIANAALITSFLAGGLSATSFFSGISSFLFAAGCAVGLCLSICTLGKILRMANYKSINTNKEFFEEFVAKGELNQVEAKLDDYYEYEAIQIFGDEFKITEELTTTVKSKPEEKIISKMISKETTNIHTNEGDEVNSTAFRNIMSDDKDEYTL